MYKKKKKKNINDSAIDKAVLWRSIATAPSLQGAYMAHKEKSKKCLTTFNSFLLHYCPFLLFYFFDSSLNRD